MPTTPASPLPDRRRRPVEELARACEHCARSLSRDGGWSTAGTVDDALARVGLPHLRSDAELFGPGHAHDDLVELSRLIERIGMLVAHLKRPCADHRVRAHAAGLMTEAAALLRRHLKRDRHPFEEMTRTLPGAELAVRLDAARTVERRARDDLRFVWQTPVPATVATVLRHNPGARRVMVLGGEHPEAIDGRG